VSHQRPTAPKYLFLAARNNRNGDRPYSPSRLRAMLAQLAARPDVRDSTGAAVDFNRTHRFRHTKATSLQRRGVASDATFRVRREDGAIRASGFRPEPGRAWLVLDTRCLRGSRLRLRWVTGCGIQICCAG
jgi:hypothetical protein